MSHFRISTSIIFCCLAVLYAGACSADGPGALNPPVAADPPGGVGTSFWFWQPVLLQNITPGFQQGGSFNISGTGMAAFFKGNGSQLTSLRADSIATGTLADARLSANIPRLSLSNTFGGPLNEFAGKVSLHGFQLDVNAAEGYVLTTDAGGIGTWQPLPESRIALPYEGTTPLPVATCAFEIINTGFGPAICGHNTSPTGATRGVVGTAASPNGVGVYGAAATGVWGTSTTTSGSGVYGEATSATGLTVGGFFKNASNAGTAVRGDATSFSGETYGGSFFSAGNIGIGVQGTAGSSTGYTFGGKFENESTDGIGVRGRANATSGGNYGGWFQTNSVSGKGVLGWATAVSGVSYGVYGRTDSSNANAYGVYAGGRLGASGTKTFRIDNPLDPENSYLMHYSSEGPEPLLIYGGTVTTDASGYAWVALPAYFEAINRDFRYQLTVIDSSADFVLAKVTQEIVDNQFQIRTSKPGVKVSWEVKGVRNDLFVQAYGAPVEVQKSDEERGKYQSPELYGLPPEMGIDYPRSQVETT